jgi:hypothetical protein
MTECGAGMIGVLVLAGTTLVACGVALLIGILPQVLERRRSHVRAAFLRAQLLSRLCTLPEFLKERDRPLPLEYRDILDEWSCMAQHAALLGIEEWMSVLRTEAVLRTARTRPSFTKRESRVAQQSVDQTVFVLQTYASDKLRSGSWWKNILLTGNAHTTRIEAAMGESVKLRDTLSSS